MDIFEQTLSSIAGGQVLDIATSRGGFVGQLKEHLASYETITGIDVDAQVLETACAKFDDPAIQFLLMDASNLGFANGRFDTISASATLHHLPHVCLTLDEVMRVLKPGGTFIFAEMHRDAQTEAQHTIVQLHHWAADVDTARGVYHQKTFTRQELVSYLEQMALQNVEIHDLSNIDSDPMDEEAIQHSQEAIDKVLQRAIGLPEYETLEARAQTLQQRISKTGVHWEPVLIVNGQKAAN